MGNERSFTIQGPLKFVGDRDGLDYLLNKHGNEIAIVLGTVRKAHYQLSVAGADKTLLDTLMRTRLLLERANRLNRHR